MLGEEARRLQQHPRLRGLTPQGGEKVLRQEQIVVGDVVDMMRCFQRMSEALISRLD